MLDFLASYFEDIAITKFTDEDYDDFRQCIFIGKKKGAARKELNQKLFDFLMQMDDESFVATQVTLVNSLIGRKTWVIPSGSTIIPSFYSRIENKKDFIEVIRTNKGFQAFVERTRPK